MYVRNYGTGLDLSWQEVFQTSNKAMVEDYCRRSRMEFEWVGEDRLRTILRAPVVETHPRTARARLV